ncbi:MAG: site-specific integrase [Candidatus Brockarchaeota archaeon]|nr:site-specific integrase [Candidatus Brockarchaeota archaeon]
MKAKRADPYALLDEFVTYLTKIGVAPHTIKDYVSCVRKWFFNDVDVEAARLRERVELPRQYTVTRDAAPTRDELRRIVMSTNLMGKALILTLASSGMMIGEALSLRVKDIDFEKHPVTIHVRAEVAKDRQARYCFISDEAANILKTYLAERINEPENYVFQGRHQGVKPDGSKYLRGKWRNEPITYWNADFIFANALKKAGLYRKDEHGRDVFHIHSLRKIFFTQLLPVLGRELLKL